jgi:preprotein translocase subunit SecG
METVIIVIHLMVIIALVAVVLMQRSEGGALGIGGTNSFMSTRGQGNVLTRSTAILGAVFFATSLAMGLLAHWQNKPSDILNQVPAVTTETAPSGATPAVPATDTGTGTLLDQLNNAPRQVPDLPSSDGTTLPGSPAAPAAPQAPTSQ